MQGPLSGATGQFSTFAGARRMTETGRTETFPRARAAATVPPSTSAWSSERHRRDHDSAKVARTGVRWWRN